MKLTILGCGGSAGVPMIGGEEGGGVTGIWGKCDPQEPKNRRTRSSVVLEEQKFRLVVDTGPDFRQQMLHAGLSSVDAVLYTHAHSDHIAGLDELRAVNRVIRRPLALFATEEVLTDLKIRFDYAFCPWKGGNFYHPVFEVTSLEVGQAVTIGPFKGHVFAQHHGHIISLGMRFERFAYSTDVETLSPEAYDILAGVETWVVGCFQHEPHPAHAWLERVLEWRERIRPRKIILTHMGPDMDYAALCDSLPQDIRPAWDGMTLEI